MKKVIWLIAILNFQLNLMSQSYFSSQSEVVDYLEGIWTADIISWMGINDTLPNEHYFNAKSLTVEFQKSNIDSLPLICKTIIDDTLADERLIEVEFEDNDGFPGPWRLKRLPHYLSFYVAILEDASYLYQLSDDSITMFQMAFDGLEYAFSRSMSTKTGELENSSITFYPNPVLNEQLCFNSTIEEFDLLRVFDINGRLQLQSQINSRHDCININVQSSGIYVIEISGKGNRVFRKLIIIAN